MPDAGEPRVARGHHGGQRGFVAHLTAHCLFDKAVPSAHCTRGQGQLLNLFVTYLPVCQVKIAMPVS